MIVSLLNVKDLLRARGGDVGTSPSRHGRRFGHVAGGQACQGHLHGGALPGASLGRRRFGAQAKAGVSPRTADHHDATPTAVLYHGPPAHLVHQTVDLLLSEGEREREHSDKATNLLQSCEPMSPPCGQRGNCGGSPHRIGTSSSGLCRTCASPRSAGHTPDRRPRCQSPEPPAQAQTQL